MLVLPYCPDSDHLRLGDDNAARDHDCLDPLVLSPPLGFIILPPFPSGFLRYLRSCAARVGPRRPRPFGSKLVVPCVYTNLFRPR